jgi:phage shock protein A
MGVFDRLSNVLKGAVSARLSDLERNNPEAVFAAALDEAGRRLKALDKSLADLGYQRDRSKEEMEVAERELQALTVEGAVGTGDDEAALAILTERERLKQVVAARAEDVAGHEARLADGKLARQEMKDNIDKLKKEQTDLLAQKKSAEARIRTQETLSGLSEDADVRGLSNVREHIDRLHRSANPGMIDDEGNSARPSLGRVDKKAKEASARMQLAALKRAKGIAPPEAAPTEDADAATPENGAEPPEEADEVLPDGEIKRTL